MFIFECKVPKFCLFTLTPWKENKDLKIRLIWAVENSQIFAKLRVARSRRSHKFTKNRFQPKLDLYLQCFVLKFRSIWRDRVLRKTSLRKGTKNDINWWKPHQNWRESDRKKKISERFILLLIGNVVILPIFIRFHIHLWHFVASTRFHFDKSVKNGQILNLPVRL